MVMEVWIDCVIAWQKALITSKEKWLSRLIKELRKTLASKCIQIIKMFKCTRDDVCGCRIFMVPVCTTCMYSLLLCRECYVNDDFSANRDFDGCKFGRTADEI